MKKEWNLFDFFAALENKDQKTIDRMNAEARQAQEAAKAEWRKNHPVGCDCETCTYHD